ncbi:MAG: succinate dehydrogenase cytochrome b subunit [Gemmatimonadaceae bacterium]|nr:succinate dehydrogenase cytochrome b subunit [Gemmatimonadaceae bacterium]
MATASAAAHAASGPPRAHRLVRLFADTIGRKSVVAVTGGLIILFLLGHLAGNLLIFRGQDAINEYAHRLKSNPIYPLLWVERVGMLGVFLLHVIGTITLTRRNRAVRPVRYEMWVPSRSTVAGRYMALSGLVILAFVVFHLLHFTLGVVDHSNTSLDLLDSAGRRDVYSALVGSFHNPWIVLSYIVAIGLLGMHLRHGISSAFQTIGVHTANDSRIVKTVMLAIVGFLVIGNWAIPLMVLFGKIPYAGGM